MGQLTSRRDASNECNSNPEAAIQKASALHARRCQDVERDIESHVKLCLMDQKASPGITARVKLLQAVKIGGPELNLAWQEIKRMGLSNRTDRLLDDLVLKFCVHEDAQIVLACIAQALEDADRANLELWLEQAEAMDLEALLPNVPVFAPLRRRLEKMKEMERRIFEQAAGHGGRDRSAWLWQRALRAVEADDEETLIDLIADAQRSGADASAAMSALEELQARRASKRRGSGTKRSSGHAGRRGSSSRESSVDAHVTREDSERATDGRSASKSSADAPVPREHCAGATDGRQQEGSFPSATWQNLMSRRNETRNSQGHRRSASSSERQQSTREDHARQERESAERERLYREEQARQERENAQRRRSYREEHAQQGHEKPGHRRRKSAPATAGRTAEALRALGLPGGPVPPLATLKAAYRAAAMRSHPDRPQNRGRQVEATHEFQEVKRAFDLLASTEMSV